ncbi:amino acid adenylation domain-containing protein [Kitasatospora sp. NPDC088391]|uniref:non-ribosomal peptide synthetase n=1 Tax=Kitasatospora sp. NPDC088391 TaxID=3364074 RepID=UPI0037FF3BCE
MSVPSALPASPFQQGIWFTERLGEVHGAYHLAVRVSFARVDEESLARAVSVVVRRHAALRQGLVERDGEVVVAPASVPVLEAVDGAAGEALDERLRAEWSRPFGPGAASARFRLFRGEDGAADLLVTVHHGVFDGESKDVLLADLAAAYAAACAGAAGGDGDGTGEGAAPEWVPPGAEQVRRAAEWFGPRWAAAGEPVLPGMPRAVTTAAPGEQVRWLVDPEGRERLAGAARGSGVTVFEYLLAALHGLLLRYGGTSVPVSVPMSARTPELAGRIGLFVNELPVCAPGGVDAGTPFAAYARAVRAEARAGYPFRTVPFASAVPGLGPRVALAPVSFGYRRSADGEAVFPGGEVRVDRAVFTGAARNTLHLQVVDGVDGLRCSLQYAPSVLAAEAAERIAGHFRTLLDGAVATPELPLGELPLLTAPEAERLAGWATGGRARIDHDADHHAPGAARTVLDLVREQARRRPDARAVTAVDGELTYRRLERRTGELAQGLRAAGVRPGDVVALLVGRTVDLPALLLAVHAAGAAYLPLDPAHPEERTASVLADSGAALLVADRDPGPGATGSVTAVLRLDGPGAEPGASADGGGSGAEPGGGVGGGGSAYVLYTSGSTGRPKGVEVGHRALLNLVRSFAADLESGPGDVWLGLTSLSFDISGLELLLPLATGGRLVLAPDGAATDGPGLRDLIGREGVTHVQATPSGWRVLLDGGSLPSGLTALVGGEALPLPLARELRSAVGRLLNVYGPTETTVWSTAAEIGPDPVAVRIGRPIANTFAYVLDPGLRPLPVGVPGELFLGGDGLAEGYRGRPGATAERFLTGADPFGGGQLPHGTRMYRTGDLAAWTADGELEYHGRIDQQVKLRGHRIELGEIESALLAHPGVAEAAVVVHTPPGGEPVLVGHLVPGAEPVPDADLVEHLRRTLPAVMVPRRWVRVERMPLTPNGKLDRRALSALPALPAPEPVAPPVPEGAVSDEAGDGDGLEEAVAEIWAQVLGLPSVGPEEDLFDLGGHSLTIVQITSRIRETLGVELDFDVFFDVPTPVGIAAAVRDGR